MSIERISQCVNKKAYIIRTKTSNGVTVEHKKPLGKVHFALFTPAGNRLVGFLIKRPDMLWMFKRKDIFVPIDVCHLQGSELHIHSSMRQLGKSALTRLALDWDSCIIWQGMDVVSQDKQMIGHISDVTLNASSGAVSEFIIDDGKIASRLVGHIKIPFSGYESCEKGRVVVNTQGISTELSKGLAADAGKKYAEAKYAGKKLAQRVNNKIDEVSSSQEYTNAAKSVGRQIKKSRSMFGDFLDEFKKASK